MAKITVERPLRLNFQASAERVARLEPEALSALMQDFGKETKEKLFSN